MRTAGLTAAADKNRGDAVDLRYSLRDYGVGILENRRQVVSIGRKR